MPTSAFLMQLVLLLHEAGVQFAPSHMKRDLNQWADEFTHPGHVGFTPERQLDVSQVLPKFSLLWMILNEDLANSSSKRTKTS